MMICSGRGERLRLFNSFFKFFSLIFLGGVFESLKGLGLTILLDWNGAS